MHIAFAIQTHPARARLSAALANELGAIEVVDPDPTGYPSPWRTYRRALEVLVSRGNVTHGVVVQDDAEPCTHLRDVLPRIAAARPRSIVALYVGGQPRVSRDAVHAACSRDEPLTVLPRAAWVPAVALLWPTEIIADALAWVDEQKWPPRFTADDEIIGRVARALDVEVVATVPSLVEHPDVVQSITGNRRRPMAGRNPDRVAACMIPDERDPRDTDWG